MSKNNSEELINVEVAYATQQEQCVLSINIKNGSNVYDAILSSGIMHHCADINLDHIQCGIFSKPVTLDALLNEGDRVEIYRELLLDPKQARRLRARAE